MSQFASLGIGLIAAPLAPLVTAALASPSIPATAGPTERRPAKAETPTAGATAIARPEASVDETAMLPSDTATAPGDSTTVADATAGASVATATTAVADGTTVPANAAAAFTRPETTTQVGTPSAFPAGPSPALGVGGAVTALIVVIALILALGWLAKRMPVLGGGAGSNPALRIVGSLALGPRERVVVVAIGDTQLLLGVGAGGTRTLHTLAEPLPVATSATPAFAQLLAQHFGKKA